MSNDTRTARIFAAPDAPARVRGFIVVTPYNPNTPDGPNVFVVGLAIPVAQAFLLRGYEAARPTAPPAFAYARSPLIHGKIEQGQRKGPGRIRT